MNKTVYVDPALLKSGSLSSAHFIKEIEKSWVIQSDVSETNNIDYYEQLSMEKVIEIYPELEKLFNSEPDRNVSFRKGSSSGKWYDFV